MDRLTIQVAGRDPRQDEETRCTPYCTRCQQRREQVVSFRSGGGGGDEPVEKAKQNTLRPAATPVGDPCCELYKKGEKEKEF